MIKVGVVDSGFSDEQSDWVEASAAFFLADEALWQADSTPDQLGHGGHILSTIRATAPNTCFYVAQVFQNRFVTTALQVAAAIDWLVEQNVEVINLSLGLHTDRPLLKSAVERALKKGIVLCASSPAKGASVYPAAYLGVFRMTGDARCSEQEWSYLETAYADFGAYVKSADGLQAGASMGNARMVGHVCRYLEQQKSASAATSPSILEVRRFLQQQAHYFGAERKENAKRSTR